MEIFLISDTHFGHANILNFKDGLGNPIRPFSSLEEMNETMITNWNNTVSNTDKIYHLGDVTFTNKWLNSIMPRLNGTKVLIKGNHDVLKPHQYLQYFKDIRAYHILDKYLLTHIPIHTESISRWKGNIHGHLHTNKVLKTIIYPPKEPYGEIILDEVEDSRYINVSVEQINYTPINFHELTSM